MKKILTKEVIENIKNNLMEQIADILNMEIRTIDVKLAGDHSNQKYVFDKNTKQYIPVDSTSNFYDNENTEVFTNEQKNTWKKDIENQISNLFEQIAVLSQQQKKEYF
jgi:hypothetical protein